MPLSLPYNIANGQAIDATPVMANFNALANVAAVGGAVAAASGANSDITSLSALTTPLTTAQGGTGINLATTPLPVAQGGTGDTGSAWTAMSGLTVSTSSGTLTTASAAGRWKRLGKTVFFELTVTVINNGTGAGSLLVSGLPFAALVAGTFAGREVNLTGLMFSATITASGTGFNMQKYDNTYPAVSGCILPFGGVIETT